MVADLRDSITQSLHRRTRREQDAARIDLELDLAICRLGDTLRKLRVCIFYKCRFRIEKYIRRIFCRIDRRNH